MLLSEGSGSPPERTFVYSSVEEEAWVVSLTWVEASRVLQTQCDIILPSLLRYAVVVLFG